MDCLFTSGAIQYPSFLHEATVLTIAERVGFEPTVPFRTSVFKTDAIDQLCHLSKFAERTGLEPATSYVTGRHSNQLNYQSVFDSNSP